MLLKIRKEGQQIGMILFRPLTGMGVGKEYSGEAISIKTGEFLKDLQIGGNTLFPLEPFYFLHIS